MSITLRSFIRTHTSSIINNSSHKSNLLSSSSSQNNHFFEQIKPIQIRFSSSLKMAKALVIGADGSESSELVSFRLIRSRAL